MRPTIRALCGTGVASAMACLALWPSPEAERSGSRAFEATPPGAASGFTPLSLPARPPDPEPDGARTPVQFGEASLRSDPSRADTHFPELLSLDQMPWDQVENRLFLAASHARTERGFQLDPRVLPALAEADLIPIIAAAEDVAIPVDRRLAGTRHGPLHRYRHVPFTALDAGPQALLELIQTRTVTAIELDVKHQPTLLDTIPLIGADTAWKNGLDGSGQVIAILDTGVEPSHPAFLNRIVDEACFSRRGDCPGGGRREFGPGSGAPCDFGCVHGTLVAGVAVGSADQEFGAGVAPGAELISIQIYSNEDGVPRAWTSDIVAALEHVYDLSVFHSIAAVSLSLGGQRYDNQDHCDEQNPSRKAIIDLLREASIATVASSGNGGSTNSISSPACISSTISVGATDKDDTVSNYSNSAEFLSLLAPGSRVTTPTRGGGYAQASGTSISAPHVAGSWAIIREASPESSVDQVLFALQMTGLPITDSRNQISTPRIDVFATIEYMTNISRESEDPAETIESAAVPPATDVPACGLVGLELAVLPLALASWIHAKRRRPRRPFPS